MRRSFVALAIIVFFFFLAPLRAAETAKTVAVLPFSVHSADNIDYVRSGVWDMLISRIAVPGKVNVISKHAVTQAIGNKRAENPEQLMELGKKLQADYIVSGSITKFGNSISLDGNLFDIAAKKSPVTIFAQSQGMDDVIPKINDFAKRIDQHLVGQVPAGFELAPLTPIVTEPAAPPKASAEPESVQALKTGKGTFTAIINPDFINAPQTADRRSFWMSQKFELEFKGMAIGNLFGDGRNAIAAIDKNHVRIYRKEGNELRLLNSLPGKSSMQYLAVDVADINGNGTDEIFVTCIDGRRLTSFVLEYQQKTFVRIASNLPWFLRVIETGRVPYLLGQVMGTDSPFTNAIHEIVWENGKYREGRRMKIPLGLSVYGLTIDSLDKDGPERIIALDENDYLKIFEPTEKPIQRLEILFGKSGELVWKSEDPFGGTNNYFEFPRDIITSGSVEPKQNYYINLRILTHDVNGDGKKEIVIVKHASATGRVLKNIRYFTSAEIYDLEWDGLGMVENWHTRKLSGYVSDYQFKDIDGDGRPELVMAVVVSSDFSPRSKSAIVAYSIAQQRTAAK